MKQRNANYNTSRSLNTAMTSITVHATSHALHGMAFQLACQCAQETAGASMQRKTSMLIIRSLHHHCSPQSFSRVSSSVQTLFLSSTRELGSSPTDLATLPKLTQQSSPPGTMKHGSFTSPVKPKLDEEWAGDPLPSFVIVTNEPSNGPSDQVAPIAVVASNMNPYLAVAPPNAPAGPTRWASGLCDCCDVLVPNCCMAWLCPCVALAQVYARIGVLPYSSALWRLSLWIVPYIIARLLLRHGSVETTTTPSYVYTVGGKIYETETVTTYSSGLLWFSYSLLLLGHAMLSWPVWLARGRIRASFQLPGDACGDCCISWWCTNCAIAQMATHVRSYRPGDCSFGPPSVLPAYIS